MEVEFPLPADLIEAVPQPKKIPEHDKHGEQSQHPQQNTAVAEFVHIEKEVRICKSGDGGAQNKDVRHIDERDDEAIERRKNGDRPLLVEENIIEDE